MKKIMIATMVALVALCSCDGEQKYLDLKGLSMGLEPEVFVDSLLNRGYEIDTTMKEVENNIFLVNNGEEKSTMTIEVDTFGIVNLQETFERETNDSTEELYWKYREMYEKIYSGNYMGKNSDVNKECIFQTKEGNVNVLLENMYRPQFRLLLEAKREE